MCQTFIINTVMLWEKRLEIGVENRIFPRQRIYPNIVEDTQPDEKTEDVAQAKTFGQGRERASACHC